jgi:branched-chain amino acid transport system permease protein
MVSLRTSGYAFLMLTIALTEFVILALNSLKDLTGGYLGIGYHGTPSRLGPIEVATPTAQYYLYLSILFLTAMVYWLIRRSAFGSRLRAIRDNSDLARSLSLNRLFHFVLMFEISAGLVGLGGPMLLLQQSIITPSLFDTYQFLNIYLMIYLGGVATIAGPILGAWLVRFLPHWLAAVGPITPNIQQLIYGMLLVFFVLMARQGLVGQAVIIYRRALTRWSPTRIAETPGRTGERAIVESAPIAALAPPPETAERALASETVLEVTELSHNFGANQALFKVSLDVRAGEIRGLIGPNGSGKTTMLNCVSGYFRPASGAIAFRGRSLRGLEFDQISSLGLVRTFQQPQVFASFTARETCRLVAASIGSRGCAREANPDLPAEPDHILELCGLGAVADELPEKLSYGQTRLLGLAAVLSRRPFLLMLDEPAAGLSHGDRAKLAEVVLWVRNASVSVVVVDHDMSFLLPLCDRITVLDYGRKIAEGEPRLVCREPAVVSAYLGPSFAARYTAPAPAQAR